MYAPSSTTASTWPAIHTVNAVPTVNVPASAKAMLTQTIVSGTTISAMFATRNA